MRTVLDTQAMLIRQNAAMQLLGEVDSSRLLLMIVAPSPEAEAASLQRARDTGEQRERAERIHGASHHTEGERRAKPKPKPEPRPRVVRAKPPVPRYVTLDDLLMRSSSRR